MKKDKEKYLVIIQYDTMDAKCSNCPNAGISLYYYPYAFIHRLTVERKVMTLW